jgi:hypothetical protein
VGDTLGRAGVSGNATLPQVLLVVQREQGGVQLPGVPFKVVDPWPALFDKDASDAYYVEEKTVEA